LFLALREYRLGVFHNRVVEDRLKRDEVIGGWRKLQNEEVHELNCSPSIIRMIKSRGRRLTVHVTGVGEKRNA
jgi:hypothetical protein